MSILSCFFREKSLARTLLVSGGLFMGLVPAGEAVAAIAPNCDVFANGSMNSFNASTNANFSGVSGTKSVYARSLSSMINTDGAQSVQVTWSNNGAVTAMFGISNGTSPITAYKSIGPGESATVYLDFTAGVSSDVLLVAEATIGLVTNAGWSQPFCGYTKDRPGYAVPSAEKKVDAGKVVTAAVSRSQTSVIQQNVGSRVSTVVSASKIGNGGAPAETATGGANTSNFTMGQTLARGFANDAQTALVGYLQESEQSDQSVNLLQKLAMEASFDTSLVGMGVDAGKIDADGVETRSALSNASPFTVWGNGSYTSLDNDFNQDGNDSRYNGDVWGYNIGLDYRFQDNLIAGLSLGYNDSSLTTDFNNGTYEEDAWVASSYAIYTPLENLHLVMEGGYGIGDIDVTRNNNAVRGTTESDLWYGAVKATYSYVPSTNLPLTLRPSVAFLASQKKVEAYRESDGTLVEAVGSNTRQLKPSLEASYDFNVRHVMLSPFVEGGLVHDFTDEINRDKTAIELGGGVRLFDQANGLNAALEGSYLAGRADYSEYTLAGTVSYGFDLRNMMGMKLVQLTPYMGSNVNELGNQAFTSGFNVAVGPLESSLSLSHNTSEVAEASSSVNFKLETKF